MSSNSTMNHSYELELGSPTINSSLNLTNWRLSEDINGSILASFVSLELILALIFNSFIIVHSVYYRIKSFRRSSTVLLFNLALSDLVMTLFYMPFTIVASCCGEWIFGRTDSFRNIFCQIHGFIFFHSSTVSNYTLAVLAVDRFLYIVKGDIYHKMMSARVVNCVIVAIWIYATVVSSIPDYNSKLEGHSWCFQIGGCILLPTTLENIVLLSIVPSLPLIVITVTSIWTLVFTRRFLRNNLKRHRKSLSLENMDIQKNIYNSRIKNLMGIFGNLLLFHLISWSLFFVCVIYAAVVSWESIPPELVATAFVLFLFNNISNPIIQIYFRNDLRDSMQATICQCCQRRKRKSQSFGVTQRSACKSRMNRTSIVRNSTILLGQISSHDVNVSGIYKVSSAAESSVLTTNGNSSSLTFQLYSSDSIKMPISSQSETICATFNKPTRLSINESVVDIAGPNAAKTLINADSTRQFTCFERESEEDININKA